MLARLLVLFLITPIVELALLIRLGQVIGFWPTIAIIAATGLAGAILARREGTSAWRRFRQRIEGGGLPGRELLDGVIILIAGALLITPGVLTDVAGFAGLLPFTRAWIRRYAMKRIQATAERGVMRMQFGPFGDAQWGAGAPTPESETEWQGEGRPSPKHRETPGGPKPPDEGG
jgi:UPF0716 protein FxsA